MREHLRASQYLLGVHPGKEVHLFMDASARRYGGGHHLIRHNLETALFMSRYFGKISTELGRQAFLEVMLHIALDAGIVNLNDVRLMSEYTRVLFRKSGPRTRLA